MRDSKIVPRSPAIETNSDYVELRVGASLSLKAPSGVSTELLDLEAPSHSVFRPASRMGMSRTKQKEFESH